MMRATRQECDVITAPGLNEKEACNFMNSSCAKSDTLISAVNRNLISNFSKLQILSDNVNHNDLTLLCPLFVPTGHSTICLVCTILFLLAPSRWELTLHLPLAEITVVLLNSGGLLVNTCLLKKLMELH